MVGGGQGKGDNRHPEIRILRNIREKFKLVFCHSQLKRSSLIQNELAFDSNFIIALQRWGHIRTLLLTPCH